MQSLSLSEKTELFSQLSETVKSLEDPVLKSWSKGYLEKHLNRYQSDLDIIANRYQRGDILELGALPCHMTFLLKKVGLPTSSIDLNPERAMEYITKNHLQVSKCDVEQESLPFPDNAFSFVLMSEVFEHLRINPLHALRETKRVLHPGGIVLLTTPNLYSLRNRWRFFTGKGLGDPVKAFQKLEAMGHMGHLREYSKNEIFRFLEIAGLKMIDHDYTYYNKPKLFLRFLYWLFPVLRPYQVLIVSTEG